MAARYTKARRERMAKALELREAGANYRAIGDELGVSHGQAYLDVRDALLEITREPAENVRDMELDRLDNLYLIAYAKARRNGDMRAVEACLRVMDRRAKFLGLDTQSREDGAKAVQSLLETLLNDPPKDGAEDPATPTTTEDTTP